MNPDPQKGSTDRKTPEERRPSVHQKQELNQKLAPLSTNITSSMQQKPSSVLPASSVHQNQLVSAPKAVAPLEELNSDAAKKVYRKRLVSSELRLIKIHPGGKPSEVKCSIFSV